jgi:hypothetical protein
MDIQLNRQIFTDESSVGELLINGQFECYTLEDVVRPIKIKGMTAIPAGVYEVVVNFSARFNRPLPLLLNVPNFDGIRIHPGNTAKDTEGCILVGQKRQKNKVVNSRLAFDPLFDKILAATAREKIFITITNQP